MNTKWASTETSPAAILETDTNVEISKRLHEIITYVLSISPALCAIYNTDVY